MQVNLEHPLVEVIATYQLSEVLIIVLSQSPISSINGVER